jgi:transcriptional regulator with XRE-family HTH domain
MTVAQARRILQRFGWTQDDVATALAASLRTVQRWLSEEHEYVPARLAVPLRAWAAFPETQPLALRRRAERAD